MSLRSKMAAELEARSDEVIAGLVDIALNGSKPDWVSCPYCKKRHQVERADASQRVRASELLIEQGYGKMGAGSAAKVPGVEIADVTLEALGRMSMRELCEFAGFEVVDGEIVDRPGRPPVDIGSWLERVGELDIDLPEGFREKVLELDRLVRAGREEVPA